MYALPMEPYAMIQVSILLSVINEFRPRKFRSVSAEPLAATRLKNTGQQYSSNIGTVRETKKVIVCYTSTGKEKTAKKQSAITA